MVGESNPSRAKVTPYSARSAYGHPASKDFVGHNAGFFRKMKRN